MVLVVKRESDTRGWSAEARPRPRPRPSQPSLREDGFPFSSRAARRQIAPSRAMLHSGKGEYIHAGGDTIWSLLALQPRSCDLHHLFQVCLHICTSC